MISARDTEYEIINAGLYKPKQDLVLFANPLSGSNLAKCYLEKKAQVLHYSLSNYEVDLHVYNLSDTKNREKACEDIQILLETNDYLRVITAGGDGSLIWVIELFANHDIALCKILFGILPFGSGNDLSAMLGWGRDPPSHKFEPYIEEWLLATPHNFDLWKIRAEVYPEGGFGKVNKTKKGFEKSFVEENGQKKIVHERLMSNYFSIGLDARIGLGFDKHRTKTKCCNKVMYCWEGFKKVFCCLRTPRITELISSMVSNGETVIENSVEKFALPQNTSVLLALNIRTYGGGDNFVWEKARGDPKVKWNKQSANDNDLEFLIFRGKIGLGLEQVKCTQGQARRINQSAGPFTLNFNQTDSKCYMQIDGEYYYMQNPKCINIELWERTREIKVLFKSS